MTEKGKKTRKRLKNWHKWPSILLSLFTLVFVVSGIVMNHRRLFSGIDVPRNYLLPEYRYNNWNNAAVRGGCRLPGDSLLVYGNIGIWLTDTLLSGFSDFNAGFPGGIDNRKVFKVYRSGSGDLLAGTLFGLYSFDPATGRWILHDMPEGGEEVVDIVEAKGRVYVMTRSWLYRIEQGAAGYSFIRETLPPPAGYRDKASLFKTLWVIHSGEIGGIAGKLFVDLLGILLAFLSVTGLVYWLFPGWIKRRKKVKKGYAWLRAANRFSVKWHNKVGVWAVGFLVIATLTGMFLRPPLLIAIANARVGKIPFTVLDNDNPWHDRLRRVIFDEAMDGFIIGTNEGIYFAASGLQDMLLPFDRQPPVSVMGINVFERTEGGDYLVGSFNGLYLWNPGQDWMIDFFSPGRAVVSDPSGPPLSKDMTAGYVRLGVEDVYVFDYNRGVMKGRQARPFPEMPAGIRDKSPMSLWNLALEFHTGRYYSFLFGSLYILFIPMFGLGMLVILFTGLWLWWKRHKKGRKDLFRRFIN